VKRSLLVIAFVVHAAAASAQPTATPPSATPPSSPPAEIQTASGAGGWAWQRTVYAFGSVESDEGFPFGLITGGDVEPTSAFSLSGVVDARREGRWGRVRAAGYGLVRNPASSRSRTYFLAGRLAYTRPIGAHWRLSADDTAKLQRRPQLDIASLERNDFTAAVEWRPSPFVGALGQFSDRRRGYYGDLDFLGYDRQAVRGAVFGAPGQRVRAEGGVTWQRYDSLLATGSRLVFGGELAAFPRQTLITLKYAWFAPYNDVRKIDLFGPPDIPPGVDVPEEVLYFDVYLAAFIELLALQSTDAELAGESFFLDPIESDNDDWDFGRRKHVLGLIVSRRLDERTSIGALFRYHRRHGPLLLNPAYLAPDLRDDRLLLRLTFRHRISARTALLLQTSHLRNTGEREYARFSRTLAALGLQFVF